MNLTSLLNTHRVPATMNTADKSTLTISRFVIIGSLVLRDFCLTTSSLTGSTPKLCAGGPSINILIHKICEQKPSQTSTHNRRNL